MKEISLIFCTECEEKITCDQSNDFWKGLCVYAVQHQDEWIPFTDNRKKISKTIKNLENNNFIVSTDHKDKIYVRPKGIYSLSEQEGYLICLTPNIHFDEK
jgi:hypothetical protein